MDHALAALELRALNFEIILELRVVIADICDRFRANVDANRLYARFARSSKVTVLTVHLAQKVARELPLRALRGTEITTT